MSYNEVLRFYSIDKSLDFFLFCIVVLVDFVLVDFVLSIGECEYFLDNICYQNEECYFFFYIYRRVGICYCKAGYYRDSINICVVSDSIGIGKLLFIFKIKCNILFKFFFFYLF